MDAGERKIYICVRRRTWFIKITISYNCVLDIKGHKCFFKYVVVNLWCWASTIMPETSQKVAETAEITKTAPKLSPKASKDPAKSS